LSRRQHSYLLCLLLLRPRHAAAAAAHEEVGGAAVLSPRSGRACRSREREGQEKACSRKRRAFRFFFPSSLSLEGFDSFHFFSDSLLVFPPLFPLSVDRSPLLLLLDRAFSRRGGLSPVLSSLKGRQREGERKREGRTPGVCLL
jgi:hypothetical protein